ncbi:hypothetical protein GCM10022267_43610 [Lentzea roselyniae]|uniref:Sporadically distributed protein, TIGR04141 family n=1 Tax=Lentzea roselyniae TaxID=531940 RepID=A0ABP7B901_9PSEU
MTRQAADTNKTSLYRVNLTAKQKEIEAIQEKYLQKGFEPKHLSIDGHDALLVYGSITNEQPDWAKHVNSLSDFLPPVGNNTSAGVLIIRLDEDHEFCYALSWGMGHITLEQKYIDTGFGLRFALRRADADQISALTTHALDTLPKTARMSVMGGTSLRSYGLEEIGEVISRLVGRIPADGLSSDVKPTVTPKGRKTKPPAKKFITVKGADSLGIPLAKKASALLDDLRFIHTVVETEKPAEGLEHLENTHPLQPKNPKTKELNAKLSELLQTGTKRLALCWPSEWDDEVGDISNFEISGFGRKWDTTVDELELSDLVDPLAATAPENRLQRLKSARVQGINSGSAASRAISGDRWITFETELNDERFVFHRGRWYNVGGAYLELLRDRVDRILSKKSPESLPPWPQMKKTRKRTGEEYIGPATEGVYNDHVATQTSGYYSLDRKLIYTQQHPRGFEACDILTPNNALVHVKRLDDSVSASHLFNQAIVSAEALRRQVDALEKFRERVRTVSNGSRDLPADFRVKEVVLAFTGGAAEAGSLFTFSQVTLTRCAQRLEELEISLTVIEIPESDELFTPPPAPVPTKKTKIN